jgi:hypothetical protein
METRSFLSPTQEQFIAALMAQPTIRAAARQVGIAESTAYQWLDDPEFKSALYKARREALDQATTHLMVTSTHAAAVLYQIAMNPNTPAPTRLRAASKALELAYRAFELYDVEARVADLERRIG